MTNIERIENLNISKECVDVVLDTDAYNEIDDQFAIAYLLSYPERANTTAIYAAPFFNAKSNGPADGMNKSYDEILKLLDLMKIEKQVFRGSESYLPCESTPVISDAARDLADRVKNYTKEKPLYIVAIGAITNIASAILLNPEVAERAVLVWLGGHARHFHNTREFNMFQDVAASRVVMGCGVPFVQLPCMGVVSEFRVSGPELEYWLCDKNDIADYLARNTIAEAESYAKGRAWTRVIWDVTAVAWLMNDNNCFMASRLVPTYLSTYDNLYAVNDNSHLMRYVYSINRDRLMDDLIKRLTK